MTNVAVNYCTHIGTDIALLAATCQRRRIALNKILASLLTVCFVAMSANFGVAKAQSTPDTQSQKIRTEVSKIGTGPKARVEAKLRDETKLKGYISGVDKDSFAVTNVNTGSVRQVSYDEVVQIKKQGHGLSTRTWIILAGAATAALVVGFTVIKPVLCDGC
jgi:hypothetical protein